MLFYLLGTVLILLCLELLLNHNRRARMIRKVPGPKKLFLIGNTLDILLPPEKLFILGRSLANSFPGLYSIWIYPFSAVNLYNPDDIEKIISTTRFNAKSLIYKFMKPWLRDGLLLSKGTKWQHRRKILTPSFHFNILKEFCVVIEENSRHLVEKLKHTEGESTDIVPVISEYTLYTICETAMGTRLQDQESEGVGNSYKQAICKLGEILVARIVAPILMSDFIFNLTPYKRKQEKHLKVLHSFTASVIEERRRYHNIRNNISEATSANDDDVFMTSKKKKTAMLDLLLSAEKEGAIDEEGVQEEVDTFMFEGHDTTAAGLTFCLMLIANHKEVQEKIVEELREVLGTSDKPATIDDLSRLKYLECCIKESLRLYPPVHFISRRIDEEVVLSNYKIPAKTFCHIHIYDLHRREELFKDALKFVPERFYPENSIGRHPYSYIPFSAGPRNCIGQKFALLEMKSCVAALLRSFILMPVTSEEELVFKSDLILRTTGAIYVKFVPRY